MGVVTLPLLLLVPVALATQIRIPGLEQLQWQASQQIAEANTRLQQSLGIYQEDAARAAAQFNNALAQISPEIQRGAGAVVAVAALVAVVGLTAAACVPKSAQH